MYYIVTTTINKPILLKKFVSDFKKYDHDFKIIVVGDLKTPSEAKEFCNELKNVIYLDVEEQKNIFKNLPIWDHIPFNSVQRRNFGYLYCIKEGINKKDVLITIDDDNFLGQEDYLSMHSKHKNFNLKYIKSDDKIWFNPLKEFFKNNTEIYPRGFTYFYRNDSKCIPKKNKISNPKIGVNAGLWENAPDIDAITRISIKDEYFKIDVDNEKLLIGEKVWCPFNSQNTAYFDDFWLTAFLSPYIGRYDDIFSSYITKKIMDHLGYYLSFGPPIVEQKRNDHNVFDDLLLELHGMSTTDIFINFLDNVVLNSDNVLGCYKEISRSIKNKFCNYNFPKGGHPFGNTKWDLNRLPEGMDLWIKSIEILKN